MEEIAIRKFHPTRLRFLKLYFLGALLISIGAIGFFNLLAAYIIFTLPTIFLPVILVGLALIAVAEIRRIYLTYIITDQKMVERHGILSKAEDVMEWSKVSLTTFKQSFIERLLNIGRIELWSIGGAEEPEIVIESVAKVKDLKGIIDGLVKEREILSAKLEIRKPPKEIVPKLTIQESISIAARHLESSKLHILSVLCAKFSGDRGVWEVLVETEGGFYFMEISNERKVIGFEKLTAAETKERLKREYKIGTEKL